MSAVIAGRRLTETGASALRADPGGSPDMNGAIEGWSVAHSLLQWVTGD